MKSRIIIISYIRWALFFTVLLLAWNNARSFFVRTTYAASSNSRASITSSLFNSNNKNNNEDDATTNKKKETDDYDESYSWAELQADEKLRQMEYNSSIKRKNAMLLPQRISRAIYTLGWTFVITGIILNAFGFAWVQNPEGGIGIGTLDQRDFQRELYRRVDDNDGGKTKDYANNHIISRLYYNNYDDGEGYVRKWLSSNEDERRTNNKQLTDETNNLLSA